MALSRPSVYGLRKILDNIFSLTPKAKISLYGGASDLKMCPSSSSIASDGEIYFDKDLNTRRKLWFIEIDEDYSRPIRHSYCININLLSMKNDFILWL